LKVLGIAGSPRHGSNTEILLEQVLEGATSKGAAIGILHISNLNIMPCSHCEGCLQGGVCSLIDDMRYVFDEIEQADYVVLAAPIHFMGVPSKVKTLIDRAQSKWCKKYVLKQPPFDDERKRQGLFVSVCGRTGEHLFEAAEVTVKAFFTSLNIKYTGKLVFSGIEERTQIRCDATALQAAYTIGEKLVLP